MRSSSSSYYNTWSRLYRTWQVRNNLITSGLYFYLYNELSTLTIKKTSATTQARRCYFMSGTALFECVRASRDWDARQTGPHGV